MEINKKLKCPICEELSSSFYRQVFDDRYGFPGKYDLFKCKSCGHIFLNTDFNEEVLTNMYTNYYPRSEYDINELEPSRDIKGLSAWFRGKHFSAYTYVPKNVKILDIGCGFGETLLYHKNRGCNVFGSEVDQNVAKASEKYGLNIKIGSYNPDNYDDNFFDYITMDQLMEHVDNPLDLLKGVQRNLKQGGKVILSTPNVYGWGVKWYKGKWVNWHAPYHLQFYSKKSMRLAAEKANLKITKVRYSTLSDWLYWQWIHLLFIPEQNHPSLFWKYMKREKYSELQIKKLNKLEKYRKLRIPDFISRFFDIIHLGDNMVFELEKPTEF